jgi:bacillithiol biosynthesis cysteine-adding enzyme BshC
MKQSWISFEQSNSFSSFFLDYINQKPALAPFYQAFPTIDNFKQQLDLKSKSFPDKVRTILVDQLTAQYLNLTITDAVKKNISDLKSAKTFTVVTGHQLNIFTGPLYFIYKIVTVINACKKLKASYPEFNFVPIYWMASEDHDYEEISTFSLYGKKYKWQTDQAGAVGRFNPESIKEILSKLPGDVKVFSDAYLKNKTLAQAARHYVNELFGSEGLIVVDADDRELKKILAPVMQDDVFNHTAKQQVDETNQKLGKEGYHTQVHAREINFFYLDAGVRERIESVEGKFVLTDSGKSISKAELEKIIKESPEKLSPNVILRPLYQEMILPNLAYVGGRAENVYWLQLKQVFDHYKITFPILLPRNFGLVLESTVSRKFSKTGLSLQDLFLSKPDLFNLFTRSNADHKLELNREKSTFEMFFNLIKQDAEKIDKTLGPLVGAESKRMLHSLEKIERKLVKAEKRFQSDKLRQLEEVKDKLFPNGSLQERSDNFLNFYQADKDFIKKILDRFDPFDFRMNIFQYDEAGT